MRSLAAIIGIPILSITAGTQIGEVEEVMLSADLTTVEGIVSNAGGGSWIALAAVHRIGRDAVIVEAISVLTDLPSDSAQWHKGAGLFDKMVVSEAGVNLGILVDIEFDLSTGEVKHYKLSGGAINDFLYGTLVMPLPTAQAVCEDRIIVPESMTKLLHT